MICSGEDLSRRRFRLCQMPAHSDELRTLAGKHEGGRAGIDRHLIGIKGAVLMHGPVAISLS
jgi:hypothetical protein